MMHMPQQVVMGGIAELKKGVLAHLESRGPLAWVVTLNPEILVQAHSHPVMARAIEGAQWVTVDGVGIQWARRVLGLPLAPRLTGVAVVNECLQWPVRLALVGGAPGVADAAAQAMTRAGATVVWVHHGFVAPEDWAKVIEALNAQDPDVILVGMGSPRQDAFIQEMAGMRGHGVAIGVGGVLDVWAGTVRRAPVWMQRVGMEWVWRVGCQPKRLGRLWRMAWPFLRWLMGAWMATKREKKGVPH